MDLAEKRVHLVRGCPAVRSWSKYRQSVWKWALCGTSSHEGILLTEDGNSSSCEFCRQIAMGVKAADRWEKRPKVKAQVEPHF